MLDAGVWVPGYPAPVSADEAYATALVGEPGRKYLWLLHRAPQLDAMVRDDWLEFARMRGYDLGDLIFPSQSGTVHREAETPR